jgi:predicted kinase
MIKLEDFMSRKDLNVIINIGIPGSGKSTWSKEYVKKNPSWVIVSRDSFRYMLKDSGVVDSKFENLITRLEEDAITVALSKGCNVIIDKTHLKLSYINQMIELCKPYADIDFRVFNTPIETCIERDLARENTVGEKVIRKMYSSFNSLMHEFNFQPVKKLRTRPTVIPNFNSDKTDAVIFDVDGTLAIMGKRSPYEWNKVDIDEPNRIVIEQIDFHRSKGRKIILLSGRDGSCRELSETWFDFYGIKYDEFHIRTAGDNRKDSIIKKEIYTKELKDKYNILCVYDDRLQVVKEWFKLGVFCFNVNQGIQEF